MHKDFDPYFGKMAGLTRQPEAAGEAPGDWSVPWADLMMVMFVLFVVLYVYAVKNKDVVVIFSQRTMPGEIAAPGEHLEGVLARFAGRSTENGQGAALENGEVFYKSGANGVSVIRERDRVRVTLRGGVFFDQGSSELKPDSLQYLAEVSEVIRLTQGSIEVVGYAGDLETDGDPGFRLTAERASNVAGYFIEAAGIAPRRFSVSGRGSYSPEVPSLTQANEDTNRRVEIIIHTGS
ncbi:MAG: OmpA family protein [Desulfovibrionaceae bacterium]